MSAQEEIKQGGAEEKPSFLKSQEARVIMYLIPAVIIMTLLAYFFKQ